VPGVVSERRNNGAGDMPLAWLAVVTQSCSLVHTPLTPRMLRTAGPRRRVPIALQSNAGYDGYKVRTLYLGTEYDECDR
jgi:hypothetical protein